MPKVPSNASIICGAVTWEPSAAAPKAKLGAVDAIAINVMNANRALRRNEDDFIAIDLSGERRTIVPRATLKLEHERERESLRRWYRPGRPGNIQHQYQERAVRGRHH